MKQYVYSPKDAGLESWPPGELRLEGIEVTQNPDEADMFVCPGPLAIFKSDKAALDRFPYLDGREERGIFFDVSDYDTIFDRKNCILIRCNTKRFMLDAHPNTVSFAWPVDDFSECIPAPDGGFKYDVSFHGWNRSSIPREIAPKACQQTRGLRCDIAGYPNFCGYIYETEEGIRRRAEFRRSMRESRIALCPESIPGVFPYRFFEAMSAGRIPMLVGSDYVYPFADRIPYREFVIEVAAKDADLSGRIALQFIAEHSDAQIIEMGLTARAAWEACLRRDDWPRTMAAAVIEKLEARALQCA